MTSIGNDGAEPGQDGFEAALQELEKVEDISRLAAPGYSKLNTTNYQGTQGALISAASRRKAYRIAVLDTPPKKAVSKAREIKAVFEPNGPRLWTDVRDTIIAFLYNE